ncbi:PhzF family phenazine biosynthesis protein [Oceanibaculum indicum]|uniref:Phenazine biosynthesis protein PhzF family n=1 Tax=Oceanibaculum indicum P24 TaxID=1207063 RepID=K2KMT1_9PROT|nr:PhzF family phenazine biosynthesis protein [Oceanibaculum indicum]EKE78825.1 phenazine biosynthesis protein PhzF family [Oceanibaculum indicum P24]
MVAQRRYTILDVFANRPLAGNPLAVVLDADGLDDREMQAIAREFNLSETVFVLPPADSRHRAAVRIFTPGRELPFAGHPTVGTAVLLALLDKAKGASAEAFGLEEKIGIVPCVAEPKGERQGRARFRLPRLPQSWGEGVSVEKAARALGLQPSEIGFGQHVPSRMSAGVRFDMVPVATLDAIGRARPGAAFEEAFGDSDHPAVYLYTAETVEAGSRFHARMFAPGLGVAEDPATGSAAASFAGALMQFEKPGDGTHDIVIEQGYEMGRPSLIDLQLVVETGALVSAEIGGDAVIVAEGTLYA